MAPKPPSTGLFVGLNKGHIVIKKELAPRPSDRKWRIDFFVGEGGRWWTACLSSLVNVKRFVKGSHITLRYDSFDGEQGFPGGVSVLITYMLIGANKLAVKMEAKPLTKATPINLALHAYWNLGGHNCADILSHELQLFGSKITPVDKELIPTGEITSVKGTPYDFLQPHTIGKMIKDLPNGYDINYVLDNIDGSSKHFKIAAIVRDDKSGRKMELWTNAVGVQLYIGALFGLIGAILSSFMRKWNLYVNKVFFNFYYINHQMPPE